jgi:superoxide dismutase, Fe-Mn family
MIRFEEVDMLFTRRTLMLGSAAVAAMQFDPRFAFAQAADTPFKLPPLPYATNALEPHIDARTMEIHHDRHHAAYVNNLNAAAKDNPQIAKQPLQELLAKLNALPEPLRTTVRNNAGGHANHSMFWETMGPGGGGQPSGDLASQISKDFGGFEKLQTSFNEAGTKLFGSGWVFVTVARDGKLGIEPRPNQDSVLMNGKHALFGNDVWEHAYYLNYQNRRADYLKAWWNTVNWNKVSERFAAAKAGTLTI